jgi:hypothetical protein
MPRRKNTVGVTRTPVKDPKAKSVPKAAARAAAAAPVNVDARSAQAEHTSPQAASGAAVDTKAVEATARGNVEPSAEVTANGTAMRRSAVAAGPALERIPLQLIEPHPRNPRLAFDENVLNAMVAQMQKRGAFDPAHALKVRQKPSGRYEIIWGHQRFEAARRAGLAEIFAFIVEMSDAEALLQLAVGNVQEPLSRLEIAIHSLSVEPAQGKEGAGIAKYARDIGLQASNLRRYRKGGSVFLAVQPELGTSDNFIRGCRGCAEQLAIIHGADRIHWVALVSWLIAGDRTMGQTQEKVRPYLPAGEDAGGGAEERAPDGAGHGNDDVSGGASKPARVTEVEGAAPPPVESNGQGEVAPQQPPATETATGDTRQNGGQVESVSHARDDRPERAEAVFRAHWDGLVELHRVFGSVNEKILRRALMSWVARLGRDYVTPDDIINHLAEQQTLATRLSEVERQCAELRAHTPRGHHHVVDAMIAAASRLRESGRELRSAHVSAVEARFSNVRTKLANAQTPIEFGVRFAGKGIA